MTTLNLTATTALEAVNRMLATIGEAPVNSLNTNGLGDVALALAALQEATREVLDRGWGFNTDERVRLPVSSEGFIYVPKNALRTKPEVDQGIRAVQRGNRMYDKDNNTFVWTNTTRLFRIVYMFDFEELPDVVRRYIAVKASRIFQQQLVGAELLEKFTAQDEYEALAAAQDYDTDTTEFNVIYGNSLGAMIAARESDLWG